MSLGLKVFISYVRENAATVAALKKDLEIRGINVWQDKDRILAGNRWKNVIKKAIGDGDFFIACFSSAFEAKGRSYMNEELNLAIGELRLRPKSTAWFIPVLLDESSIPDWEISAAETLQDIQWVSMFPDWDDGIERIYQTIAINGSEESVRRLHMAYIQALNDGNKSVRNAASVALVQSRSTAIPYLLASFQTSNSICKKLIIDILIKIGSEDPAPWMVKALGDPENLVREEAARYLGIFSRDDKVFFVLKNAAQNQDPVVREKVVEALGQSWKEEAFEILIRAIDDPVAQVRANAVIALEQYHQRALDARERPGGAVKAFEAHSEKSRQLISKAMTDPSETVRMSAIQALGCFLDQKELIVDTLVKALQDPCSEVRSSAAYLLGSAKARNAVKALETILRDNSASVRRATVFALGEISSKKVTNDLLSLMDDKDSYVAATAIASLGKIGDPRTIPFVEKFVNSSDHYMRGEVAVTLGRLGGEGALELLTKMLKDDVPSVRGAAIKGLSELGDKRAILHIKELENDEESVSAINYYPVKDFAKEALKALQKKKTRRRMSPQAGKGDALR